MKKDVYGHQQRYERWKETVKIEGEPGLTKKNSDILTRYIFDMEIGANVSRLSKKGGRSYPRLNNLRQRLAQIMRMMQERNVSDITKVSEKKITELFSDMRKGVIKTQKGHVYKSPQDYVKIFKSFWNWWIKINRKNGINIQNIAEDLDTSRDEQPEFVYIEKNDFMEKFLPYFSKEEQLILLFVYDSLIRSPTELKSLRVKDIFQKKDEVWVNIPDEISKVMGRQLNLIYCGEELSKYIRENEKQPDDYLFEFNHIVFYRKMKKVARQIWGDRISHPKARGKFRDITLYDLRHSGAISLRIKIHENPKALSIDTLRERGGWKNYRMLDYYTKFIGLSGEIKKDKLLLEEDKTNLEKELEKLKSARDNEIDAIKKQMKKVLKGLADLKAKGQQQNVSA
jgi:integrase